MPIADWKHKELPLYYSFETYFREEWLEDNFTGKEYLQKCATIQLYDPNGEAVPNGLATARNMDELDTKVHLLIELAHNHDQARYAAQAFEDEAVKWAAKNNVNLNIQD